MEEQIVVGVDIGTTKVCAMVASSDDLGRINILGVGVAPSEGLNRGVVVNIDKTVEAVHSAIDDAERAAGLSVQRVIVGIAGDHIQSFQSRGVITIRQPEISADDVERVLDDTRHVALPGDRQILHVMPQEFIVDGQDGVGDPVGMSGIRLEANVHIITGLISAVQNIYRCIEKAGRHVADIVLEPLASSFAVLHPDEKEMGVALIDIGGGTTDIAVFEDNMIRHTAVVAVAGNQVTEDIRKGLAIMRSDAEQLKCQYGLAFAGMVEEDAEISIPGISGRPEKVVRQSTLSQIIQPRTEEILEIVDQELKRSGYGGQLGAGVVLTGGGSLIPGTVEVASDILGMEARLGRSSGLSGGLVEEVTNPKFSTGVGLVLYGLRPESLSNLPFSLVMDQDHGPLRGEGTIRERIKERMTSWFDEL